MTCSNWQMVDYGSFVQMQDFAQFKELLAFDPQLFALITGGCLLTFIGAHIAGIVVKTMNRT